MITIVLLETRIQTDYKSTSKRESVKLQLASSIVIARMTALLAGA